MNRIEDATAILNAGSCGAWRRGGFTPHPPSPRRSGRAAGPARPAVAGESRPRRAMPRAASVRWLLLLALIVLAPAAPLAAETLDTFDDAGAWQVIASDGLEAKIASEGGVLRLDYDFRGHAGYVVLRRQIELTLPERWAFDLRLRGMGPRNNFEFKLLDPSLENVWWVNRRGYALPAEWLDLRTRGSRFEFAWGPLGGGAPKTLAAIELAIAAGEGGQGQVFFDRLDFVALPPASAVPPKRVARASSEEAGHAAALALDGDAATSWKPAAGASRGAALTFEADLGEPRELGGLLLRWPEASGPRSYTVEGSLDGANWQPLRRFAAAAGGADAFVAPELELRHLRLSFTAAKGGRELDPRGLELRELEILPPKLGEDRNALVSRLAALSPRGDYPRAFHGETAFWTVAGEDGGRDEALLSEDGALEPWRGAFSLEPFVVAPGGEILGWPEAQATPHLPPGGLPLPAVSLAYAGGVTLEVETASSAIALFARYRLRNGGGAPAQLGLVLALRPFQVDPPWQFLSQHGGVTRVEELTLAPAFAKAEGREVLRVEPPAARVGAQSFEEGSLIGRLRAGRPPAATMVHDVGDGLASGYFRWQWDLAPGEERTVTVALPWPGVAPVAGPLDFERRHADAVAFWQERLSAVTLELPPAAGDLAAVVRSALGHILIHRDGAGIQPGSRSYERSWIRDGALTSSALLRFGLYDVARDFLDWFAPYQFENGKVPCCVDGRGADPVPENDSGGQLIYLAHEVWRFGGDRQLLEKLWPRIEKAVSYIDELRQKRRGQAWETPEKKVFYGLLPESISHEGYSAKPMHSYWDDFWALRGLEDAALLAEALGHPKKAAAWASMRDEFAHDVLASLELAMAQHQIAYLPGCAELGDFDATSTAVALAPGRLRDRLPQGPLRYTFERYYDEVAARFGGQKDWDAYTAYELRNAGALIRLGEKEKAWQVLSWLLADRRPIAWNQMPEVTFREARAPRFNGDLPHGWVASELLRSVADMFAYENDQGDFEVAAGMPLAWLEGEGAGPVAVKGMRTPWGPLGCDLRRDGDQVKLKVDGLTIPPGHALYIHSPWGERLKVDTLPAEVTFSKP